MTKVIVVEGCNFSGKTTFIKNKNEKVWREGGMTLVCHTPFFKNGDSLRLVPTDIEIQYKKLIDHVIRYGGNSQSFFMLMYGIHMIAKRKIEETPTSKIILMDRNFLSTLVYQYEYVNKYTEILDIMSGLIFDKNIIETDVILLQPPFEVIQKRVNDGRKKDSEVTDVFDTKLRNKYDLYERFIPIIREKFYPNLKVIRDFF